MSTTATTPPSMAERGRKGGCMTLARHGRAHMADIGRRGFQATCARHWNGDRAAFTAWLSAKGLWAADPYRYNGAFRDPGPWPARAWCCWECDQPRPFPEPTCPHCGASILPPVGHTNYQPAPF